MYYYRAQVGLVFPAMGLDQFTSPSSAELLWLGEYSKLGLVCRTGSNSISMQKGSFEHSDTNTSLPHLQHHSVQFSSVAQSCPTLCDPMNRSMPGLPVHHQLPEFTQTHVHQVGDAISHLILCHPLLLLPPIPPSIRVFSNESTLRMSWPKYWSFSFSISPSSEHQVLISFRMDWLDLLAVQGTLKSLL